MSMFEKTRFSAIHYYHKQAPTLFGICLFIFEKQHHLVGIYNHKAAMTEVYLICMSYYLYKEMEQDLVLRIVPVVDH